MSRRKLTDHILRGNAPVVMSTLQTLVQHVVVGGSSNNIGASTNNSLQECRRAASQPRLPQNQQNGSISNLQGSKSVQKSPLPASERNPPAHSGSSQHSAQRTYRISETSAASLFLTPKQRVLQQQRWRAEQRKEEMDPISERKAAWQPRSPLHELHGQSHHHNLHDKQRAGHHASAIAAAEISMCIREMEESAYLSTFEDHVDDFSFNSPGAGEQPAEAESDRRGAAAWWASPPMPPHHARTTTTTTANNLNNQPLLPEEPKAAKQEQEQAQAEKNEQEPRPNFVETQPAREPRLMSQGTGRNASKPEMMIISSGAAQASPLDPQPQRPQARQFEFEQEPNPSGRQKGQGGQGRDPQRESAKPKAVGVGGWLQKLGIPLGPVTEAVGQRDQDGGAVFVYPAWQDGVRLCALLERLDVSVRNGIRGVQRPPKGPAVCFHTCCNYKEARLLRCGTVRLLTSFWLNHAHCVVFTLMDRRRHFIMSS